uniref:Uncharacterized protein n=1 Tax=Candidatus Kentrum eta TaxID=2126337 RepID=A0A450VII5_9GAMM|nr:MAG: hypothetical protein BECKH772B_GA0070898_104681 [Candidatus Kentron sp. H]VFK05324.1 MAG: hypothetical protein BECKH772A_GA0070896_105321 [Candidatus Kentron sp. H]VFK08597.1 MAG: hypothetical protein BECKH772C_GA0070978_105271 [Candidatus Kentron sp. H]
MPSVFIRFVSYASRMEFAVAMANRFVSVPPLRQTSIDIIFIRIHKGSWPGQPNETVFQLPLTYFVAGT